jgi:acetylornithine deacetylase/succinyl-diaminopimelate desuccinylase-like protein
MSPAVPVLLSSLFAAPPPPGVPVAREHRQTHGASILREFADLLAIPNVARDHENIRRTASFIVEAFARRGVELETLEVRGAPPLIVGELKVPGATRTVGIYVHYDGQPVDASEWTSPPWQPTLYTTSVESGGTPRPLPADGEAIDPEWRLYARAAGDDKAPLITLLAALDALQAADVPLTSNLKFMFEGEEEVGSPHLREYFARYSDRLGVDVWLICDGPVHQSRRPQLVFGVRGVTSMQVTLYGATRSLHSGHYGNWAPNPAVLLANLIASMKNADGRVLIEGWLDTVEPLSTVEQAAIETVPVVDESLRAELGLADTEGDATLTERLLLPALNIRGIAAATVGPTARNVIPNTATAEVGIRLVKGNDPVHMQELVEAHIRKQGYHIVRDEPDAATRRAHPRIAMVRRRGGYPAARASMDLDIVPGLVAAAAAASGEEVILMPSLGGSLPLYLFQEMLEAPTIIVPIANHDNNQHAPDENIRLANLWYGVDLMGGLLTLPD